MNPTESERHYGKLVKWDDSRGFGFIEPAGGGKSIFVHIKDIRPGERRPAEGDTVFYEIGVGNQGKPKAINAFVAGVRPLQRASRVLRHDKYGWLKTGASLLAIVGFFITMYIIDQPRVFSRSSDEYEAKATQGMIKGNISYTSGAKYYHTPGMRDYDITEINESRGERWFRTEEEARAAGWTRAPGE